MKVIDLLNKIANGERPEKIKYKDEVYNWDKNVGNYILNDDKNVSINWDYVSMFALEEKAVIIEEDKKIEKIETYDIAGNIFIDDDSFKYIPIDKDKLTANEQVFVDKINEIIDKIISMEVK